MEYLDILRFLFGLLVFDNVIICPNEWGRFVNCHGSHDKSWSWFSTVNFKFMNYFDGMKILLK